MLQEDNAAERLSPREARAPFYPVNIPGVENHDRTSIKIMNIPALRDQITYFSHRGDQGTDNEGLCSAFGFPDVVALFAGTGTIHSANLFSRFSFNHTAYSGRLKASLTFLEIVTCPFPVMDATVIKSSLMINFLRLVGKRKI